MKPEVIAQAPSSILPHLPTGTKNRIDCSASTKWENVWASGVSGTVA